MQRRAGRRFGGLGKDTRAISEGISDGSAELPQDLAESFFEFLVDDYMLVDAEVFAR